MENYKCDKYDYMIAVSCGAIGGIIDIFLVGAPGDSKLGNWSDNQVDKMVQTFAKMMGWEGEKSRSISSAIDFLEKSRTVNYDGIKDDSILGMGALNHHMKSLAHSPDVIGLFFSVLDQFLSRSTFLSDGQMISIKTDDINKNR